MIICLTTWYSGRLGSEKSPAYFGSANNASGHVSRHPAEDPAYWIISLWDPIWAWWMRRRAARGMSPYLTRWTQTVPGSLVICLTVWYKQYQTVLLFVHVSWQSRKSHWELQTNHFLAISPLHIWRKRLKSMNASISSFSLLPSRTTTTPRSWNNKSNII